MKQSVSLFFSTGDVARLLHVSQDTLRKLCESRAIRAETTPGGQWRIPKSEVERLQRDGLPPVPRPLPGEALPSPAAKPRGTAAGLPEFVSAETVAAKDEVERLKAEVEGLSLRQQKEEALDWFRNRNREQEERRAEQAREEQRAQAEAERARRRQSWFDSWQEYALAKIPNQARGQVESEVYQAVAAVLKDRDPEQDSGVTRRLVDAAFERALASWRREKQIEQVLCEARDSWLPREARNSFRGLTSWQVAAMKAAGAAIGELPDNATIEEIRAVAQDAVRKVAAEFEAHQAAERDAVMREQVIRNARLPLEAGGSEREEIIEAIRKAVVQQPPGTPQWKLERVRDEVLAPIQQAYDRKREEERQREEAERQRRWEEFEQRLKRSDAESNAQWRLMKVYDYLGEIEEVEFEDDRNRWDTAEKLKTLIQPQLVQEILEHPEMTYNQMDERIKALVRQHLESMLEE